MKFKKLEKISGGAFLHRYDITYTDDAGRGYTYEMVRKSHLIFIQRNRVVLKNSST